MSTIRIFLLAVAFCFLCAKLVCALSFSLRRSAGLRCESTCLAPMSWTSSCSVRLACICSGHIPGRRQQASMAAAATSGAAAPAMHGGGLVSRGQRKEKRIAQTATTLPASITGKKGHQGPALRAHMLQCGNVEETFEGDDRAHRDHPAKSWCRIQWRTPAHCCSLCALRGGAPECRRRHVQPPRLCCSRVCHSNSLQVRATGASQLAGLPPGALRPSRVACTVRGPVCMQMGAGHMAAGPVARSRITQISGLGTSVLGALQEGVARLRASNSSTQVRHQACTQVRHQACTQVKHQACPHVHLGRYTWTLGGCTWTLWFGGTHMDAWEVRMDWTVRQHLSGPCLVLHAHPGCKMETKLHVAFKSVRSRLLGPTGGIKCVSRGWCSCTSVGALVGAGGALAPQLVLLHLSWAPAPQLVCTQGLAFPHL